MEDGMRRRFQCIRSRQTDLALQCEKRGNETDGERNFISHRRSYKKISLC